MPKTPSPVLSMERAKAFCDGVLAVVITLLVLGLEVPEGHDFDHDGLVGFLRKILHDVHPYVGSFALISAYWVQHTVIFHYVDTGGRGLVWLNLVFLFVISPLPFLTQLRADYPEEPIVAVVFGVVQILCGLMLLALWHWGTQAREGAPIDARTDRSMRRRILLGPLIVILATAAAFVDAHLASAILLCMPLLYLSHRQVDTDWQLLDEARSASTSRQDG